MNIILLCIYIFNLHVDIKYWHMIHKGIINLVYLDTDHIIADIETKVLAKEKFIWHRVWRIAIERSIGRESEKCKHRKFNS